MRTFLFFIVLEIIALSAEAQNRYFITFKDKANSPYSISNPSQYLSNRSIQRRQKQGINISERDLPPNPAYVNTIANTGGIRVLYKSRWFNGILIESNSTTATTQILALPFVKGVEVSSVVSNARLGIDNERNNIYNKFQNEAANGYGPSLTQVTMLGADSMHNAGYHGEGMLIGVLDSGFKNANILSCFNALYAQNRVIGTFDFVSNNTSVYEDDSHGTNVLSCMAAYSPDTLIGTAYKASYLLLRTEDASSETKMEEAYWAFGAEYADSVGVDVINSSLGYSEFDNAAQNYTYNDMNGDVAICTRAADYAAQAGILVVVAAGNQGNDPWKYITAPSDADSVLSVAAVEPNKIRTFFSSIGPSPDGRVKPDLAAQGAAVAIASVNGGFGSSAGTSFASPLLAGMAAGFWQANPTLTNMQVIDCLKKSASQASNPDPFLGYGIPNFRVAISKIDNCANPSCIPSFFRIK